MSHSEVFVIGAGPAGLTAAYLLTKQGISTTVIEADPDLRRRHQPHGELQGLPVRHRRPSLLLEVEGGRRSVEGDPARRFHRRVRACRASTTTASTISYPLKAFEALGQPRRRRKRAVRAVVHVQAGVPEREARDFPRLGRQPVRRAAVLDLLQDLHREGVGHELRRNLGRLGRAAHQGPRPVERPWRMRCATP